MSSENGVADREPAEVVPLAVFMTAIRTAQEAMKIMTDEQLTELRHRLDAMDREVA
jgi:hypothetical protein